MQRPVLASALVGAAAALVAAPAAFGGAGEACSPWDVLPPPIPAGSGHTVVRDVTVLAPDNAWAVGSFNTDRIRPFSAHWDGSSWTFHPVPQPISFANSTLWAVGASGPDNIWAAGDRQYTPPLPFAFFGTHIFVVRWDGSQWQMMETPHLGGGSGDIIWGIKVFGPDDVWFVGDDHPQASAPQPALAMHWNGSSFNLTQVPIVNPEAGSRAGNPLYDISALPGGELWVAGGTDVNALGSGGYSQIHRYRNGQWQHIPGPTPGYFNQLFAIEAIAPDDVWAGGEYWDASGIFGLLMHFDGTSWTQVPAPGTISDFYAFASNDIYAVGSRIYHYNGVQWSVVENFSGIDGPSLVAIDSAGDCSLYAGGRQIISGQIQSFVARSQGGGTSCYANCDQSTTPPILNVEDFTCFINEFASAQALPHAQQLPHYANCDQSTTVPILNVEDFTCFINRFAQGCR
jgi:hypothetical protein